MNRPPKLSRPVSAELVADLPRRIVEAGSAQAKRAMVERVSSLRAEPAYERLRVRQTARYRASDLGRRPASAQQLSLGECSL
jgi:hypothetical protein